MSSKQEYQQVFSARYNQANEREYGRGRMTTLERATLRELQEKVRDDVKERVFGDRELNVKDKQTLRDMTRNEVVDEIIRNGWLQPDRELVVAKDIAESGIEHACVVAEYLVDVRGPEAGPDTFFSYTTKNQFDRYVSMRLIKGNRLKRGSGLFFEWHGLQNRQIGYENPNVGYVKYPFF